MDRYVTPEEFAKLSKGKKVKEYPNPLVKEIEGIRYEIIKPEAICRVYKLPHDQYKWFIGCTFEKYQEVVKETYGEESSEIVVIGTDTKAGYYWFPTDLVCGTAPKHIGSGIIREQFCIHSDLAKKTGYWQLRNNTGSMECYFRSAKVHEAIRILNENNWRCPQLEE